MNNYVNLTFMSVNKNFKNAIKYFLSLSIAVVLLYFCFRKIDWLEFWNAFKACRWGFVLLSMLAGATAFYVRSSRWRMLLLPIYPETSRITTFNAVNIGYIANLAFSYIGEFVKCGVVTAHSPKEEGEDGNSRRKAPYNKVLGTIVVERSWDIVSMLIILLTFILLTWKRFGSFFAEEIFGVTAGRLNLSSILLIAGAILLVVLLLAAIFKMSRRWKALVPVADFIRGIGNGVTSCLRMENSWFFFVQTLLLWCCYWMMSATILWAVQGIDTTAVSADLASAVGITRGLNLTDAMFLMLAGAISSVVPVPGGFGAFHFIVAGAISSVYGLPFEFGIIFATLSHESQELNQLFWGGVSFIIEQFRKD